MGGVPEGVMSWGESVRLEERWEVVIGPDIILRLSENRELLIPWSEGTR